MGELLRGRIVTHFAPFQPFAVGEPRPVHRLSVPRLSMAEAMEYLGIEDEADVLTTGFFSEWRPDDRGLYHLIFRLPLWSILPTARSVDVQSLGEATFIPIFRDWGSGILLDGTPLAVVFNRLIFGRPELARIYGRGDRLDHEAIERRHIFEREPLMRLPSHNTSWVLGAERPGERAPYVYAQLVSYLWVELRNRLTSGNLLTDGFWKGETRARLPIDPTVWSNVRLAINLKTFAVVDTESGVLEWDSIVLRASTTIATVEPRKNGESKTKPEALTDWLLTKFPNKPTLTTDELMRLARDDLNIGTFSKRTMETAISAAFRKK